MFRTLRFALLPLAVFILAAASDSSRPPWDNSPSKSKPIQQWDQADAKQVLADSPWVKYVSPEQVRDLSPGERRDGGDWDAGIGPGVGLAGTGLFGSRRQAEALKRAHAMPQFEPVAVRWESALPVRYAEQKAGEKDAPTLDGDDYAIAVYDIPTPHSWNLARELKGIAFLSRYKKKDLKPSRVKILRQDPDDEKATVVYLFPRSVEITKKDGKVLFVAQIGRLFVSQYFDTAEMQLQGELQLLLPSN